MCQSSTGWWWSVLQLKRKSLYCEWKMIIKNWTLPNRHLGACDWPVRSYTGPELSSKTDIVLNVGNYYPKLKPSKQKLLFFFKNMLKRYLVKYFKLNLGYIRAYFRLSWFFMCARHFCAAKKSYTITDLKKRTAPRAAEILFLFFFCVNVGRH